jgi:hypothetical protein
MKTYFIKTSHEIEIDEFNEGLTNLVNTYNLEDKIQAETPRKAIEKYFSSVLYYNFTFENAYIMHLEEGGKDKNVLIYDVFVDEESQEVDENDKILWEKGEKTLYNNRIYLKIYEINPAII